MTMTVSDSGMMMICAMIFLMYLLVGVQGQGGDAPGPSGGGSVEPFVKSGILYPVRVFVVLLPFDSAK